MQELRSIVQKMHRNPRILKGGWKEYFYFLDEYFKTMVNDPSKLVLFLVEDCARCPLALLKAVKNSVLSGKRVQKEDYRRVSASIAMQPLDRSAAYLSVACMDYVSPISEEEMQSLIRTRDHQWETYLCTQTELGPKQSFTACMTLMEREVKDLPCEYPMSPHTALRLAASVNRLVEWDSKNPEVRVDNDLVGSLLGNAFSPGIDFKVTNARPLIFGFVAVYDWCYRAGDSLDERVRVFVKQYLHIALACCSKLSARLDLVVMNAILVLMGRFPDEAAPDVLTKDLPCDPKDVPDYPRAFPMPKVAQDRHTRRGLRMADTTQSLMSQCEKRGVPVPDNIEYSHGPPSHKTVQGFEEFMEHIRHCEEQTSDGLDPVFKETAMRLYRALPDGVPKKRMNILKLKMSGESCAKRPCTKRKATGTMCEPERKRHCMDWVRDRLPDGHDSQTEWQTLVKGCPIGQKPCGKKPAVFIHSSRREVIKGPLPGFEQAFRSACMTRLAREVLGLEHCIPDARVIVTSDDRIGLASPMIGDMGDVSEEGVVSSNANRGLCKLHEYNGDWMEKLSNPLDVLRIVAAKSIVGSSDNNTSNVLIEHHTGRVYGLDLGGQRRKTLQPNYQSFEWAFSKSTSKHVLKQLEVVIKRYAGQMVKWLLSLKSEQTQQQWEKVVAEYPFPVTVPDLLQEVDVFLDFFQNTILK